jgi:Mn2+/Fe2+ NRAMP family transporter
VLGFEAIFGNTTIKIGAISLNGFSLMIGFIAFIILFIGKYKVLEKILVFLVILMSLAFLVTAILTKPSIVEIFKGIF